MHVAAALNCERKPSFHVGVAAHYYDCQDHFPHLQDSAFMVGAEGKKKIFHDRPTLDISIPWGCSD